MAIFNNKQLCPICQTGKETYELDKKSPCCPYLTCHKLKSCPFFVEIKKPVKNCTA